MQFVTISVLSSRRKSLPCSSDFQYSPVLDRPVRIVGPAVTASFAPMPLRTRAVEARPSLPSPELVATSSIVFYAWQTLPSSLGVIRTHLASVRDVLLRHLFCNKCFLVFQRSVDSHSLYLNGSWFQ